MAHQKMSEVIKAIKTDWCAGCEGGIPVNFETIFRDHVQDMLLNKLQILIFDRTEKGEDVSDLLALTQSIRD